MWENVMIVLEILGLLFLFVLASAIILWVVICLTAAIYEVKRSVDDDETLNN